MPSGRVERVAKMVVIGSTLWLAIAVTWGLFAPIGGGHWAIVASRGIMGDNMVTWGLWGPAREYALDRPTPQLYYVHHPWGTYWVIGALTKLFGRHSFVPRLEPVLMCVACPPLLYGIARALWGPVPGALAALAYAVLPIVLAFGNFPGFEGPLNFGVLVTTWGYVRLQKQWKRRWMIVSLAGTLWSINCDWEAGIFAGTVLGTLLVTSFFLPRWFGRVDARRFGQWWAASFCIVVVTVFAYLAYVKHIGAVDEFLGQEAKREKGNDLPLFQVLASRRYWIDTSFTPLAVTVGKIAAPVFLFRLLFLRRPLEIFPLAILVMATVEYVHFKNGADVHTFWPLPFAPYWALSLAVLARTGLDLADMAMLRVERVPAGLTREAVSFGVFGALGLLPLLVMPDGVRGLYYARVTGGRYSDRGRRIFQDVDKSEAAAWMGGRMEGPPSRVLIHGSMRSTWAVDWALRRPTLSVDGPPTRSPSPADRYFLADLAFMKVGDQLKMARGFHMVAVGQFVLVDREAPAAPADGFVFDVREPGALEWYLSAGTDPIRTVRPDPWYTWELRDTFGQTPNPAPPLDPPPAALDDLRIAHNVAVATGDVARAEALQAQLFAKIDAQPATKYTDGTLLLGERYTDGVAPVLDLYFQAAGPAAVDDLQYEIQAIADRAPLLSLVGRDDRPKATAMPLTIPPRLWKTGFIYASHSEIRHRPGRERFIGFFIGGPEASRPRPVDGARDVPLLTIR
jgi:Dolichyl-phosphate-mannose-protein mannosyltransferase